ncbi:MAG TPA: glycosyltransferase family 39 protein [Candidatus Sulfotelmatobacter sp.]|nr:glycosyltransferase family 39 protein [Candidatus Sulfotelmatobacter sp.]
MNKLLLKFRFLVLGLILFLGFFLRQDKINTWPRLGATFDEYAWTWQGISLIQKKVPVSWSRHPQYKNFKLITYQKVPFQLVTPYLEHPPLFGLVAGSFAILNGVKDSMHVDINHIRGLALILGVLSIFILYVFAAEVYGFKIGLISSFLYSIIPTIAVGSRIVENENFFIPFFLLSLYLTSKFIKTNNPIFRNLAGVVCGLLTLAKVPWIAAALGIVLVLFYIRKYKDAFKFLAVVLPIFSLFFVYGWYYDWNLFINLWKLQLSRYDLTFNSFFALFTSPYLVDRFLIDGWIYFGWFTLLLLAVKDLRKNFMVLLPFLAYFAVFVFAIPNEAGHGWYRYPFYPFLVISTALFLKEYFTKNYLLTFLFLIFTGLSMLQLSWAQKVGFSFLVFRSFLILFGISLTPLFIPKTGKVAYLSSYFSLIIISVLSVWSVFKYNEQ